MRVKIFVLLIAAILFYSIFALSHQRFHSSEAFIVGKKSIPDTSLSRHHQLRTPVIKSKEDEETKTEGHNRGQVAKVVEKISIVQAEQQQHDENKSPSSSGRATSHLPNRRASPLDQLTKDNDGVRPTVELKQIHHGIYKVLSPSPPGILYALKTECRPPAKWHGQQGWPEIAVHSFSHLLFGAQGNTVPFAKGWRALISEDQRDRIVHRDQCGVVKENSSPSSGPLHQKMKSEEGNGQEGQFRIPLIGVALEWQANHNDQALPAKSFAQYFQPPPSSSKSSFTVHLDKTESEDLAQISDIQVLDYLVMNDDREDKNWFYNNTHYRVAMDNGWAFAGKEYSESICSLHSSNLVCPPLLRYLSKKGQKKKGVCGGLVNCRYRASTVKQLKQLLSKWDGPLGAQWLRYISADELIAWLISTYPNSIFRGGNRQYCEALARYTHGCPRQEASNVWKHQKILKYLEIMSNNVEGGSVISSSNADDSVDDQHQNESNVPFILQLLHFGMNGRLKKLVEHIDQCVTQYGEKYSLLL